MPSKVDMTGKRFGRLVVISEGECRKFGGLAWVCQCDCGRITEPIAGGSLRSGFTKSCGCLRAEAVSKTGKSNKMHGMSHTKIHNVWNGMKQRCANPNHKFYENYGGRGITVCREWQESFETFYDHVSQLPHFGEAGYSLDRSNNDGNYEPGNVRWATASEQQTNKRAYRSYNRKGSEVWK